jgi:hypothetical protein
MSHLGIFALLCFIRFEYLKRYRLMQQYYRMLQLTAQLLDRHYFLLKK